MRIRLYKLAAKLRGRKVVILHDHDGEENLRIALYKNGHFVAKRFGFNIHWVSLNPDFSCDKISWKKITKEPVLSHSYVEKWSWV